MPIPETQTTSSLHNLESLQTERYDLAVAVSEQQLRGVFAVDRVQNPDVSFTRVKNNGFGYDASLQADELLALDALGVDLAEIISKTGYDSGKQDELIETIRLNDEFTTISRYSDGMTLKFKKDGHRPDSIHPLRSVAMRDAIAARFAVSPAHQAIAHINEQLQHTYILPGSVSTEPFDGMSDPLGTAAFLKQVGLTSSGYQLSTELRHGTPMSEALALSLDNSLAYGTKVHEDESARTFTWGKGAVRQLSIDKATGGFTFSVAMDPASNYLETPDQAPSVESIPFVETQCARELSTLLDRAGLTFSPEFRDMMVSMSDSDRYGSVYTALSREVAKWINNPSRTHLSRLFDLYQAKSEYDDEIEELVRSKWARSDHAVEGEAATVLVDMIDNALARDSSQAQPTDIPVTKQRFEIRDGACFDVASYYIRAAGENWSRDNMRVTADTGTEMLTKTHGSPTFMLTAPALFNGVPLPKGALLSKKEDGYAFLRLTSFTFDNPADQLALDPELAKARQNESASIQAIGGVTLSHLVAAVKK